MAHSRNKRGKQSRSRKSIAARRANPRGGTIINVLVAVIFFGLIALGIWWLMKSIGETGQQYTDAMVKAKYNALTVKCQTNMRTIGQNIQMYAITNETLPPSSQALEQWCGSSQLFHCPDPNGARYIYIPGQDGRMPDNNILLYGPNPVHNGRCSVLRLGGQIELLSPEELRIALARTRQSLR
jgi:hypothetical protein